MRLSLSDCQSHHAPMRKATSKNKSLALSRFRYFFVVPITMPQGQKCGWCRVGGHNRVTCKFYEVYRKKTRKTSELRCWSEAIVEAAARKVTADTEVQSSQIIKDLDGLITDLNSTSSRIRRASATKYVGHQPHRGQQPHNSRRDGVSA